MTKYKIVTTAFKGALAFFICLFSNNTIAQCAGSNGTITVCEKDADEANKTFNLFPVLTGNPQQGGTWSTNDPANFFALDRATGIVNLWKIKNSGIHEFTYKNNCGELEDETAIVTINLGGYPGENNIDGSADACGDDEMVNLHSYIGNETEGKFQDFNGVWEAATPSATTHLNENIFNAKAAGPGIYQFTYSTPEVATCSGRQVTLRLEVQQPAKSGEGTNLVLCNIDDLSDYTDFDLDDLLTDEDVNGTWSEGSETNQLDDLSDHIINIEEIVEAQKYGVFEFTYTVFPSHAVCSKSETKVELTIQQALQATMTATNFCEDLTSYEIEISDYNMDYLESGTYSLSYNISTESGDTPGTAPLTLKNDETGSFSIEASKIPIDEIITLSITSIAPDVCTTTDVESIQFIVTNPMTEITPSCEEENIPVSLSNIYDPMLKKANGTYDTTYTLIAPSGANNSFTLQNLSFTNGNATFEIPAEQITETGEYTINFEVDSGFNFDCEITGSVNITPIPEDISIDLIINNSCNASEIEILVNAPVLSTGSYNITYDITQQTTGTVVINNTINSTGGTESYELDIASLERGNYTLNVKSIQDDTTPCRKIFEFEETENFAIDGVPEVAEGKENQSFCANEYATTGPTLNDIEISSNGEIIFYDTETSTTPLPITSTLQNGENYFAAYADTENECEGPERIEITIAIINPEMPTSEDVNPSFCDSENVTLSQIQVSASEGSTIAWFDSATDGNRLESDTIITNGVSYYAASETPNGCFSRNRLEIAATVYELESATLLLYNIELCGLDNPTVSELQQLESTTDYEVKWYDAPENGNEFSNDSPLAEDITYYAQSFNPNTGCINPERRAVTVVLSNCDPEEYDFFIPDGFSPNGDGRNDTFFIPNIETIYPEYTLEIINRYGSSIFKGDRNKPEWNGQMNNTVAPNGVYFYIIEFNKGDRKPEQGRLYLNR